MPSLTSPVPVATMYIVARNHVHGHRIPASLDHFVDFFHKFHEFRVALEPERNLAYASAVFVSILLGSAVSICSRMKPTEPRILAYICQSWQNEAFAEKTPRDHANKLTEPAPVGISAAHLL